MAETTPAPPARLTAYEDRRLVDVRDWYERRPGTTDRLLAGASDRARAVVDRALDSDRGRDAIRRGTERVLAELDGRLLLGVDEVRPFLDGPDAAARGRALRRADRRAAELNARYVGWLSGQAAIAGAASLTLPLAVVAMAADIASAVIGSFRAAGHTLVVYGLDPQHPQLLPATVSLVAAASETEASVRQRTIRDGLDLLTGDGAIPLPEERLPRVVAQQTGSRTIREAVEQTLRRVVRRRAVVFVPVLGAVASGAASGWLAARVMEAARHTGAVTFLHEHANIPIDVLLGATPRV